MSELIAADHDRDEAGHLRDGSGEQVLKGSESSVKRGSALRERHSRDQEDER